MSKEVLHLSTRKRVEFIDITLEVEKALAKSGVKDGICLVFCPHTTAGITINENADPSVKKDINSHLDKLIPYGKSYTHAEGNSDAHIKSSLMGPEMSVIVQDSQLVLGTWQGIYFCEFDGPRSRKVYVKIISG